MAQQSSRLHRLLTLLDTGSTQATRFTAARQIGDIAKSHPQDLDSLLKKVSQYLHSKNWDTRVAAAHAIGSIAENVKHISFKELLACVEVEMVEAGNSNMAKDVVMGLPHFHPLTETALSFSSFDIRKVLEFGPPLLASVGQEYDIANDSKKNSIEGIARQKQKFRRRLGLDVCEQFMDVSDMVRDEDFLVHKVHPHGNGHGYYASQSRQHLPHSVANVVPNFYSKRLSAREMNLLKRKAKVNAKDHPKGWSEDDKYEAAYSQNPATPRGEGQDSLDSNNKVLMEAGVDEVGLEQDGDGKWPFRHFVEQLILEMFDPIWEVRHGSVMALREILTHHAASAGVDMPDLSIGSSCLVEVEDKPNNVYNTAKRSREFDLNVQFGVGDSEPCTKRLKSEKESSVFVSSVASPDVCLKIEDVSCASSGLVLGELHMGPGPVKSEPGQYLETSHFDCEEVEDIPEKIIASEDQSSNLKMGMATNLLSSHVSGDSTGLAMGELHTSPVKSEPDQFLETSHFDSKEVEDIAEQKVACEDHSSNLKMGMTMNLQEGSKLMRLVKLGRNSWIRNCEFLQDCAIRFLCILLLDRFGDYVSDQVVAPVRETCAQALGVVLKYMHPASVHETLNVLLQMQCRQEWEIRHGSLLGIKYLVAVRREMLPELLPCVLPACKIGLEDADDDVRAVAAEALLPTAAAIVSLKGQTLRSMVMLLWDILLDLDDLSPSTSSVMNLLAEIYSQPEMVPKMLGALEKQELDLNEVVQADELGDGVNNEQNPYILATLAPRLWPFMRHSITSVRHAAIRTLERLLEAGCRKSLSEPMSHSFWPVSILGDTLRIVFQNMLLEANDEILQCSDRVWRLLIQCPESDLDAAARSYMSSWIQLATTPYGSTLDATKMFWPLALPRKSHFRAAAKMRAVKLDNQATQSYGFDSLKDNIFQDRSEISNLTKIVVGADSQKSVTHTRVATATALGILASKLPETSLPFVVDTLWNDLTSLSGVQRQVASMVLIAWFRELKNKGIIGIPVSMLPSVDNVRKWLLDLLACTDPSLPTKDSNLPYLELSRTYTKMKNEASQLFRLVDSSDMFKSLLSTVNFDPDAVSVDDAINFASKLSTLADHSTGREPSETHIPDDMESLKQRLLSTSGYLKCVQGNLHITVSALVAAAVIWMSELPMRLNPIILPLMAAIKREQEEILQQKAAEALAELISHCIARRPSPNDKLIKNLCSLICMDPCETPQAALINSMDIIEDHDLLSFGREAAGNNQKTKVQVLSAGEDRSRVEGFISRRGAEFALKHLCEKFGGTLFDKLPKLWDYLTEVLKPCTSEGRSVTDDQVITQIVDSMKDLQALINNIQVVRSIAPMVDETLKPKLLTLLPFIFGCVRHRHVAVRLAASRCIASMAKSMTASVMGLVIEKVIPMLGDTVSVHARQGAGMLVSLLVQGLGVELVPYATLLVVPLLGCMSDSDHAVRQSVTHSFAALVPLLPLARGLPPPVGLSEGLYKNAEDAQFLEQLLDNSHIDDYKLSTELKVTLRRYQQEGINWLSFLRRFKLHGILCDDMGLGKTLQASAIVASDIAERRAKSNDKDLLSLIICPSTLVGHWAYEIEKFIDVSIITPLQYMGSVQDRTLLRDQFGKYNVIITSYDVIRKDIDYLGKLAWNYCILDEGHIIKNSKSKITSAVKQLKAEHRLILSGTPIQNNVLELWSLFDFLMPGFLGTERQFQATYGKPLVAARDPKCSAKDAEAGALAMEALHKQVMPFLLRRTKDEVLSDLPEKIIQDRYCDLSPVQLKLYEQFSGSDVRQEISTLVEVTDTPKTVEVASPSPKASSHVFQALQYLLKLCSHPLLVLGEKPPDSIMRVVSELIPGSANLMLDLHELHHSPKLVALREILEECGVGWNASSSEGVAGVGQHRVLIFAQHKSFLDIIERDLFQTHMKSVTYLRLDGSVEPEKRFDIVKAFNSDPTIDVLLLTTHVGGLGLNLTSADTLVFMEHDWNPMRDHQAMDRAHRLGQRKVVNVHRLIMRGTLEEKVMSLQKFKVSIANAVINAENTSMKTMNTDQLLDLFTSAQTITKGPAHSKNSNSTFDEVSKSVTGGKGLKAILTGLEELWDHSQYTEEYNLSQFLAKLND